MSLPGDVNADGARNAVDGLFVLQFDADLRASSDEFPTPADAVALPLCDVTGDAECNSLDALFILQCEAGVSNSLCSAPG